MATDGRRALNGKADGDGITAFWGDINVLASNLGRAVVVQWQQINLVGRHDAWAHDGREGGRSVSAPRGICTEALCCLCRGAAAIHH